MTRHVGVRLSAYVDRRLDPGALREIDRHLVACQVCCHAVDQERRLLSSLRFGSTPRVSEGLQASLMSLGASPAPALPASDRPARMEPVPTVSPSRPGLHRSPRRAAGLAGFAASASAAAAIGLAVAGPGATAASLRTPSPRPSGSTVSETTLASPVATPVARVGYGAAAARVAVALTGFTRPSGVDTVRPPGATVWSRSLSSGR
jgi:anti-sigma factor RsiW